MDNHFKNLVDSSKKPEFGNEKEDVSATPSQLPSPLSNSNAQTHIGGSSSTPTPLLPQLSEAPKFIFGQNFRPENSACLEDLVDTTPCKLEKPSEKPTLSSIMEAIFGEEEKEESVCDSPSKLPLSRSNYNPNSIFGSVSSSGSSTPPPQPSETPPIRFIFGQNHSLQSSGRLADLADKSCKHKKFDGESVEGVKKGPQVKDVTENEAQSQGEGKKTWNLRPRRPIQTPGSQNVGAGNFGTQNMQEKKNEEKKNKKKAINDAKVPIMPKFSATLTKEEIREDFIKMTGKPPPAKPKTKRKMKKEIQQNLDRLHIGALLNLVSLKDYEAHEPK